MAHSNRHWPSMFKSKPCTTHHQWQNDLNHSVFSNSCSKSPYPSVGEERSPEPKPRWNPKPEQIRILEAIFNSGMVNPPRDEIRRIRAQLQEYGQVGDANVFYWFQNRKSRSKHKNRNLQSAKLDQQARSTVPPPSPPLAQPAPTSSSSSSSDKPSPGKEKKVALEVSTLLDMSNSPTASVNQTSFTPITGDLLPEPFVFQVQQAPVANGYCFSDFSGLFQVPESGSMQYTGLLHELMSQEVGRKEVEDKMKMNCHNLVTSTTISATTSAIPTASVVASALSGIEGAAASGCPAGTMAPSAGATRSTVFINDEAFEVGPGPLNVREAFGDDAFLLYFSGQPVPTNEWGITLHPLQHGAFYYLV